MSVCDINLDAVWPHGVTCRIQLSVLPVKVKYRGTKSYYESFEDDGLKEGIKSTTFSAKNLVPGSQYNFKVYATTVCGKSSSTCLEVETTMKGEHFLMTLI